jgi:predicted naringenin-chalcone synthase
MNPPRLLSIGLATPERALSREDGERLSAELAPVTVRRSALAALHQRSGVDSRGVSILTGRGEQSLYAHDPRGLGPTTGARLARYTDAATDLAVRAARDALDRAGLDARRVTHLTTVSCTGFEAPGVDLNVIEALGISRSVRRTTVGFMGCHGAINGLAAVAAQAREPDAVALLVCVELCSLHHHYSDRSDQLVANALFADGAAAAVVAPAGPAEAPALAGFSSTIFPDASAMGWRIGDHGFEMTLSPRTPGLLREQAPAWVDETLASHGLDRAAVGGWAIHPGGARIVRAMAEGLGLGDDAIADSLRVLREHGNMSSATVLFVLRRLWDAKAPRPWAALAFGPGLAAEAALLT